MNSDAGKLTGLQLAVTAAALEGDAAAIYHLVRDLLSEGMPLSAVLFEVLAPVQAAMGHRWQTADYLISEEHAATSAIATVVALLAGSLEQPEDAPRVVVAAVQGDAHSLPGRLIAAHLLYSGYRTTLLGATMPASDLRQFLADDPPDFLVLTCAMTMHLPGARASIAAGHAVGVPVLVGGPAFGADGAWATRLGADGWVGALEDVAGKLDSWEPVISAPSTAELSAELQNLIDGRPLYVTGAAAALASQAGAGGVRHYEELELLFDVLVSSMIVDEDIVLVEFAGWLAALLDAHGADVAAVGAIIDALRIVVEPASQAAAHRLAAAASQITSR